MPPVHFGGEPDLPDHVPVLNGWNYVVRLHQPGPQIPDASWAFPAIEHQHT
jgi:hypothetical protein